MMRCNICSPWWSLITGLAIKMPTWVKAIPIHDVRGQIATTKYVHIPHRASYVRRLLKHILSDICDYIDKR